MRRRKRSVPAGRRRRLVALALGMGAAACLASGCGRPPAPAAEAERGPAAPVRVAEARTGDLTNVVVYTGSVEPTRVARLASPAEGPILECTVREGDAVDAGQRLARVGRDRMAATALAAAREDWRRATAEFARIERLVTSGSVPGEQLDAARAGLRRAEAQVAAMETGIADHEITAPWAGIVSRVWVAEGEYVSPRTALMEIFDPASLLVRFPVAEQDLPAVGVGLEVEVLLDVYPGRIFPARVARVFPELDAATRTGTVEAELREPPPLWRGAFARVRIPTRVVRNAVILPESALVLMPDGDPVVFVAAEERAGLRRIEVALEAGGRLALVGGVEAGERVVVSGAESLRDGMAVRVMPPPAAAARGEGRPTEPPAPARPADDDRVPDRR